MNLRVHIYIIKQNLHISMNNFFNQADLSIFVSKPLSFCRIEYETNDFFTVSI